MADVVSSFGVVLIRASLLIGLMLTSDAFDVQRAQAAVADSHPCVGRWVGEGRNSGFSTTWTIEMIITSGGDQCGTIEYRRPNCGGTLTQCDSTGPNSVSSREHYSHGEAACAPPGRVEFTCEGNTMRWAWIGWERVETTLTRTGAPEGASATPASPAVNGGQPAPPPSSNARGTPSDPLPRVVPVPGIAPEQGTPSNSAYPPPPPPPPPAAADPSGPTGLCACRTAGKRSMPLGTLLAGLGLGALMFWRRR